MDARTKTKLVNALMTKFVKLYEDKYDRKLNFNRYTQKWGFGDMFQDLQGDAQDVLEYYFTLKRRHSPQDLLSNYHEIAVWMQEDIEDDINRRQLAIETKKRVEEHRARWQQKPST